MQEQTIDRHKTIRAMVRGFFEGFFSALTEAASQKSSLRGAMLVKRVAADSADHVADFFCHTMFPLISRVNYSDLDALTALLRAKHVSEATPAKVLMRLACGSRELYQTMVDEYRRQMESLLSGHIQTPGEHLAADALSGGLPLVPVAEAIRGVVRSMMQGYAEGLRAVSSTDFSQQTVLRMMVNGMHTLLHDHEITSWGDNPDLNDIYLKVSGTPENYETVINEMNQAYEDFAGQ